MSKQPSCESRSLLSALCGVSFLLIAFLLIGGCANPVIVHSKSATWIKLSYSPTGSNSIKSAWVTEATAEKMVLEKAQEHCATHEKVAVLKTKLDQRTFFYSCVPKYSVE